MDRLMTSFTKKFILNCLSGLFFALGLFGVIHGVIILCSHPCTFGLQIVSGGNFSILFGILFFKVACDIEKRERSLYSIPFSTRQRVRREVCDICGHRTNNGRCSFCADIDERWFPTDGSSRIESAGMAAERNHFDQRNAYNEYDEWRIRSLRPSAINNTYERTQEYIRQMQLAQAMMNQPSPIIIAEQHNPTSPLTFNILKNRETKEVKLTEENKEVKQPAKRQVLNAISDLEINE